MNKPIRAKHYIVTNYWLEYYADKHCTLCGNHGRIDTTGTETPAGLEVGRINYCICPNGQALRVAGAPLVEIPEEVIRHFELYEHECDWCGASLVSIISNLSDTMRIVCPNKCDKTQKWSQEERAVFVEQLIHGQVKTREIER